MNDVGNLLVRTVVALIVWLAYTLPGFAQLDLDGLQLVEEGPAAEAAGDPVPDNLALDGTPFASSDLGPEIGTPYHVTENLNDGAYGNAFSWIGGDDNPFLDAFAGIDLGGDPISNLQSIAFGRSNVLSGDVCGPVCTDRHQGFYILQYTQVANPASELDLNTSGNPQTGWVDVGTLEYGASEGPETLYNRTWQRHRYNFDPVDATGIRLIVPGTGLAEGTAIDEIELFDMPGEVVDPPPPPPPVQITPVRGFEISWDGNEGEFFDELEPPDGSIVPDNLALASRGATPFASSDLGPEIGVDFHVRENLNDGFYGNSNSWIGGADNPFEPDVFAGVALSEPSEITSIAWGRDNGNNFTDACGGQCTDRSVGTYTIQFTQVEDPNEDTEATEDAATGWQTIGDVRYAADTVEFTEYLRHEYDLSRGGQPIVATGVRLLVSAVGTAIDELELYRGGLPTMACDVTGDGVCDVQDIDMLSGQIRAGSTDAALDLDGDGSVGDADRSFWIVQLMNTWTGDANLDGQFDSSDFVAVFTAGKFETDQSASWAEGDWNGDGLFDSGDFVAAFRDGGFEMGERQAVAAVPEPGAGALLVGAGFALLATCRRKMNAERTILWGA